MSASVALRRAGALAVGGVLGLALAAGLGDAPLLAVWPLHQAVQQMQAEHQRAAGLAPGQTVADGSVAPAADRPAVGPVVGEHDAAWLWLQQRLQAHGLRVEVLRPEAVQAGAVLASQVAHLRVLGAWADWMAWGQRMAEHAPWWQWLQWQVLPMGAAGQVQVEGRLRLCLRPASTPATPAWAGPLWPAPPAREVAVLFGSEPVTAPAAQAVAAAPASTPAWSWWGVWMQAGQTHVVLGREADWTLLAPGQTLAQTPGHQAWRIEHIGAEGLHLKERGAGPSLFLPWEGTP